MDNKKLIRRKKKGKKVDCFSIFLREEPVSRKVKNPCPMSEYCGGLVCSGSMHAGSPLRTFCARSCRAHTTPLGARTVYLGLNEVGTGPLGNT